MPNWNSTAFVFAGQGSQIIGMGKDIADTYPVARDIFQQADDLLGFSLSQLCFNGSEAALNDTINTQPALYVYGIAMLKALQTERPDASPSFLAGHSFGEFTALVVSGALTFEDGLRLVRERGRVMKAAGETSPGAMAAILGLDTETLQNVCMQAVAQVGGVLVIANDNCPGQIVISGHNETLDVGMVLAKEAGARRVVKLAVSIASHSPLMQPAANEFKIALDNTMFRVPGVPVYANVSATPLLDEVSIREEFTNQLTSTVRWTESVQRMITDGAEQFVEFGPKDVLSGLIRRIDGSKQAVSLNNLNALQQFIQSIE